MLSSRYCCCRAKAISILLIIVNTISYDSNVIYCNTAVAIVVEPNRVIDIDSILEQEKFGKQETVSAL